MEGDEMRLYIIDEYRPNYKGNMISTRSYLPWSGDCSENSFF